jgi:hypothetical protein
MSLTERINEEIKNAMRAKDQASLRALRALKSAFLLATTAEGRDNTQPLTEAEELRALQKQVKQRRDSIEQFRSNGREDLATGELEELAVLERFMPQQLSEAELRAELQQLAATNGLQTAADLGKLMKMAQQAFAGRADNKLVADLAKQVLA